MHGRGAYQIDRLEEFPSFIECQDSSGNCIGLILLKTPEEIRLQYRWKIGVDFGTSFTNVYVNNNRTVEPLSMESLHLKGLCCMKVVIAKNFHQEVN
ncbi:hypothetical protein [Trichodesmium erythraeum]|uniref:hypothetical protein n=1 Tax=Trichodesmium erythraeum TaxID=1206 RepID=UPI0012DEF751